MYLTQEQTFITLLATCLMMTGLIAIIQLIHYPMFKDIELNEFKVKGDLEPCHAVCCSNVDSALASHARGMEFKSASEQCLVGSLWMIFPSS